VFVWPGGEPWHCEGGSDRPTLKDYAALTVILLLLVVPWVLNLASDHIYVLLEWLVPAHYKVGWSIGAPLVEI
jgi:hypothetical protein